MKKDKNYRYLANYGELGTKTVKDKCLPLQLVREAWGDYCCFAIRIFSEKGDPLRGISLTTSQAIELRDALNSIDFDRFRKIKKTS